MTSSKPNTIFITGTDTDAGKTLVSAALLIYLNTLGKKTLAFKPVSAGCQATPDGLRNQDALELGALASVKIPYEKINPFAFEPPIAPHIAALQNTPFTEISIEKIVSCYNTLEFYKPDIIITEGAGGWRIPINSKEYLSDFVKATHIPVILVAGLRLGCINHTILTYEAIQKDGVKLIGWVANVLDPHMQVIQENIDYLKTIINKPLLGIIPHNKNINSKKMGKYLNFNLLHCC